MNIVVKNTPKIKDMYVTDETITAYLNGWKGHFF